MVYAEILGIDDALAKWAKNRKKSSYWPEPDGDVQSTYRDIAQHVEKHYRASSPAKLGNFLAKADCWIIAHAKAKGGTVVSRESKVDKRSLTPKVPNVCATFDVPFIETMAMLKILKFKL